MISSETPKKERNSNSSLVLSGIHMLIFLGVIFLAFLAFSHQILAIPQPAAEFYGTVANKDGTPVVAGTNITA